MRSYKIQLLLLIPCFFVANGCFYKAQKTTEQKENILPVKVIAVLPVKSKSNQNMATPELLRKKLCDELHFRGYDTIPLSALDEKLNAVHPSSDPMTSTKFSVQSLPEFFEFDAVMDCKLLQDSHKKSFFIHPLSSRQSVNCVARQRTSFFGVARRRLKTVILILPLRELKEKSTKITKILLLKLWTSYLRNYPTGRISVKVNKIF